VEDHQANQKQKTHLQLHNQPNPFQPHLDLHDQVGRMVLVMTFLTKITLVLVVLLTNFHLLRMMSSVVVLLFRGGKFLIVIKFRFLAFVKVLKSPTIENITTY
jgi:hypothetical protein